MSYARAAKRNHNGDKESLSPCAKKTRTEHKGNYNLRFLPMGGKRTNDDVHGSIEICPVFEAVLNTPQVQRLRKLKQLGVAEHVYACATHNRFEHSLGVAHLAERICEQLRRGQRKLGITEKDILCVKLAGLCHDLGHGPFSHVYDGEFLNLVKKAEEKCCDGNGPYAKFPKIPNKFEHEDASLMMIDVSNFINCFLLTFPSIFILPFSSSI